jgi:hypothetical protein
MKRIIIKTCIFFTFLFPILLYAQGGPSDPGIDPNVPIDGGLSILIAAGVGIGVKKIKDNYYSKK